MLFDKLADLRSHNRAIKPLCTLVLLGGVTGPGNAKVPIMKSCPNVLPKSVLVHGQGSDIER